jgi:hypothetical protein
MTEPMLAPLALEPDTLRVLHLKVTSPAGAPLSLQVPWDRTPRDLAHALVAGTTLETPERAIHVVSPGSDDVLDAPLRQAIRHAANPDGPVALVLQVETGLDRFEAVLTCVDVTEPEPHQAYPHGLDDESSQRLAPFLAAHEPDWFCDGLQGLACCAKLHEAPQDQEWVFL